MGSMRTLYIDLASHDGLLACMTGEAVAAAVPVNHRIDDAALMPLVEGILVNAGWSYRDLTQIACVIGPGGFTSLRVAVALANAVSHELGIPSCGIHLSDLYESRIQNDESQKALWVHSTKKHELFIRGFGDTQKKFPESACITTDELVRAVRERPLQWMGELIPEHRKIVDESGAKEAPLRPLEETLPEFLKQPNYQKQILTPWYGRNW